MKKTINDDVEGAQYMKWKSSCLAFVFVLACLFPACSRDSHDGRSFLSFEVEGKRYDLSDIMFTHLPLSGATRQMIDIGFDPARVNVSAAAPAVAIQWKGEFSRAADLEGSTIDLSLPDHGAMVQFILENPETGLVHEAENPDMQIRIEDVDPHFVMGTFSGKGFSRVAPGEAPRRGITVSGSFRATLQSITR